MLAGYIGEFEIIDDHRGGKVVIELIGRINKCGVISPRFDIKLKSIEQWMSNLLPSRQFGYIVLTTSLGIMDQEEVNPLQTTQARLRPMRGRPCAGLLTDDFGVTLSVRRVLVFYVLLHLV